MLGLLHDVILKCRNNQTFCYICGKGELKAIVKPYVLLPKRIIDFMDIKKGKPVKIYPESRSRIVVEFG